jgi:hypothetical protein
MPTSNSTNLPIKNKNSYSILHFVAHNRMLAYADWGLMQELRLQSY